MPDKLYYSIGEVAAEMGVKPSLLRFWETELPSIKPYKNKKGTRYYTPDDIKQLKYIYHLTRDCGYTLDGVREQLRHTNNTPKQQLVETLTDLRAFLVGLKEQL